VTDPDAPPDDGRSDDDAARDWAGGDGERRAAGRDGSDPPATDSSRGFLYRHLPSVGMAVRNLTRTRRRSALAALGIVIGVVAITTLGMFGVAVRVQADASFSHVGNEVVVEAAQEADRETLTRRQVVAVDRLTEGTVVPVRRDYVTVRAGGRRNARQPGARGTGEVERDRSIAQVYGVRNPGVVYDARAGRVRNPLESGVLAGQTVADRHDLVPGDTVVLDNRSYRVAAVLANYTNASYSNLEVRNAFVVPPRTVNASGYHEVTVVTANRSAANRTAVTLRAGMNADGRVVDVTGPDAYASDVSEFYRALNLALLGIASISLTVAGVSILNVMLMSTVERRGEIGVLRAVGFHRRHVLRMILAEAAMLGVVGGAVGVAISSLAGLVIFDQILGDAAAVVHPRVFFYVGLGFGFAVLTALVSGAYPAWTAASERPVDALRS
jgi:putative ABC transport system permease protein